MKSNKTVFAAVLTLVACGSCIPHPTPMAPVMDIQVLKSNSTVLFKFHRRGQVARAVRVEVTIITPDGNASHPTAIWEIAAEGSDAGVAEVTYGILPPQFSRMIPAEGNVPSLQAEVKYCVFAVGSDGSRGSAVFDLSLVSPIKGSDQDKKFPRTGFPNPSVASR